MDGLARSLKRRTNMPCRDEGAYDSYGAEQKEKLDKVTRLLCALCKHIEDYEGVGIYISNVENGELKTWWEAHKKADAKRETEEAEDRRRQKVRNYALNKLTQEEKDLLRIGKL